jgi:hypothetical protein
VRALVWLVVLGGVARAQSARLDGVVLERGTERPLPGVTVTATDLQRGTATDGDGHFTLIDLPPGTHHLTLSLADATAEVDEDLPPGAARTVIYRLQTAKKSAFESTVRARVRREVVETSVRVEEGRKVAGTQGDAIKVVQSLPGVARAGFGQGQLIVWGAAPADTRIYVDGVEVPLLYHLGGFRSTVNDSLVRSIDFVPGGQGAEWSRGLGGLVSLQTRPLRSDGVHGQVAADVLDANAMLEIPLGSRVTLAVAGRYSYLDQILKSVVAPDVGDFVPIPRWDDYQLILHARLRPGEQLGLTFLGADDHLDRAVPSADPTRVRHELTDQSFYRFALRYGRATPSVITDITPFFGFDRAALTQEFGGTPTHLDTDGWRYGLRASNRNRLTQWAWLTLGADLLGTRSAVDRVGSLTLPAREGDVFVFGQPPANDLQADKYSIHQLDAQAWVQAGFTAGPVTLTPGLRAGPVLIQGDHLSPASPTAPVPGFGRLDWTVEPRLAVAWRAHERVTVSAAGGLYHQAPDPADLSAVFGNPLLDLQRAWQLTAALDVSITGELSIQTVGFVKWLDDLVTRSELPSPPIGHALVQDGTGFAYGGQLLLRLRPWRGLSGWISYTASRSERRDHPDVAVRLFDYDQTHVLAFVASYSWRGLSVGARLRWSSGFPRTPVASAYYDARDDQFQPVFGAQNSIRLPDFVQLDLRAEYTFKLKRSSLDLYLDVQNVTDQANKEEIAYTENFSKLQYITGLPTTAVFGARVQF